MKTAVKIILIIICLSVLGGVAFGIYRLTGGFKGDVALFYVTYKDKRVTNLDNNLLHISSEKTETFEVVYVLDEFKGTPSDYSVVIKPNKYKQDFHYKINNIYYAWSEIDLSKAFIIEKSATSFTVRSVTNSFEEMISLILATLLPCAFASAAMSSSEVGTNS